MTEKKDKKAVAKKPETDDILLALSEGMTKMLGGIEDLGGRMAIVEASVASNAEEIKRVKTGDKDAFKRDAKEADIEAASEHRKGVDPKLVSIVDEVLGTDFGVEMAPLGGNQMGYQFTVIVPERLNDNEMEQRPIKGSDGQYKHDQLGNVVMENFKREDRRSKMVSSSDGYGSIREHCEKVRAYMQAYYAAQHRPMPELKVKTGN